MKAYCTNCEEIQPASFRPECSEKGDYEDLCCDECHMILATVEERDVGVGQRMVAIFYKDSDGSRWLYSLDGSNSPIRWWRLFPTASATGASSSRTTATGSNTRSTRRPSAPAAFLPDPPHERAEHPVQGSRHAHLIVLDKKSSSASCTRRRPTPQPS